MNHAPDGGRTDEPGGGWVLGVDSGGSGIRFALGYAEPGVPYRLAGTAEGDEPVATGPSGIDPAHLMRQLVPAARDLLERAGAPGARLAAVCVGAAGMATLGAGLRAELPGLLAESFGVRRVALAADAVTAYAGALGERAGAVVAAGTGMIALGTDLRTWRRADGWGYLLGDCGSGAWIGRAGLAAAMRAYDGRPGGSAALRARAEALFGTPLDGLPAQLYPRPDRAAVLASFAPEVAACAALDPVAADILHTAATEIATTAAAVCPAGADFAYAADCAEAADIAEANTANAMNTANATDTANSANSAIGRGDRDGATSRRDRDDAAGARDHDGVHGAAADNLGNGVHRTAADGETDGRAGRGHAAGAYGRSDGDEDGAYGRCGGDEDGAYGRCGGDEDGAYGRSGGDEEDAYGRSGKGEDGAGVGRVEVAFTGGLFQLGAPLTGAVRRQLGERLPGVRVREAAGSPLDGALLIAERLAVGRLALPATPPLLTVAGCPASTAEPSASQCLKGD